MKFNNNCDQLLQTLKFLSLLIFYNYQIHAEKYIHDVSLKGKETSREIIRKAANVLPSKRQLAYHKYEFTGFIHFGINTFTGKEWGNGLESPIVFNPKKVDTDQWCQTMKEAGMRLVMITAKHHDGFCLWQTRYNDHFSVKNSPWKNGTGDVLKQLAISAKKYNLKLGVYLSPADLYQIESENGLYGNFSNYQESVIPTDPKFFQSRPLKARHTNYPQFRVKADDYNRYFMNQLYELLTEYGPIHEVWFDGAHPKRQGGQTYMKKKWFNMIRTLAPEAVIFGGPDVRWCGNEAGYTRLNEWNILPIESYETSGYDRPQLEIATDDKLTAKEYDVYGRKFKSKHLYYIISEVDTSLRNGWFWRNKTEQKPKSVDWAFDVYERTVGGNAVFLLNVPPNKDGVLSLPDTQIMKELGEKIQQTYHNDNKLLQGATSTVPNILDGKINTYWQAEESASMFTITLPNERTVNRLCIQEAIGDVGQRIKNHSVDAWLNNQWIEISQAGVVGYKRIHRFPSIKTERFRVRILDSREKPAVANVSLHYYKIPPSSVIIKRDKTHKIALSSASKGVIRYTSDGSLPTKNSNIYHYPLDFPNGVLLKAKVFSEKHESSVSEKSMSISAINWKIYSNDEGISSSHLKKAIDADIQTYWESHDLSDKEQSITIDLGSSKKIRSVSYLPPQNKVGGMIEKYSLQISNDGINWEEAARSQFGNIINDPSERLITFKGFKITRYVKLISLKNANGVSQAGIAEFQVYP